MAQKTDGFQGAQAQPLQVIDREGRILHGPADIAVDTEDTILASLPKETDDLLATAMRRHRSIDGRNRLTILVPRRDSPVDKIRRDDVVTGFLASGPWSRSILEWVGCDPRERCFRALSEVLNDDQASIRLDIVHSARMPEGFARSIAKRVDIVLAHRGADEYLRAAVASIEDPARAGRTILCFDQHANPALVEALSENDALELYEVLPSPVGPYVPRQHFCMTSRADYVAFQDTDDYSVSSRIETLVDFAETHGGDVVGCHELRCDELTRTVEAIRLPLDANRGLDIEPAAVQLFATTVIRTDCLRRLGGFSTVRTFGADRQFQLRAHWSARILNVDAFLYVRRLRENSLTTAPKTGMQSQIRQDVNAAWQEAFRAHGEGSIGLAGSALSVEPAGFTPIIRNLRTGRECEAVLDPTKISTPKPR